MRSRTVISILAATVLALTSMASIAGQGQGQGGANADRSHQVDRDRTYDRDRMSDRDRMRNEDPIQKRDQDQDRTKLHDPAKMQDQDIYGSEMMTAQERKQYRKELGGAKSPQAHNEFQAQHEQKMQERALQQGQDLVPPGQGPIYGGEFMSVQERNEYREQLRLMDPEQSEQFQAQHRDRINQRANALKLEVEEAE